MSFLPEWSRRRFIACSTAAAAGVSHRVDVFGQSKSQFPRSASSSPEEIAGGLRPLLTDNTARPLRYTPEAGDFVIRNGKEFFNRPLYGPNNAFRVDAGDLPEFSLYLPGHGGNLRLGIATANDSKWLSHASEIVARYRPGRMIYEIRDAIFDGGILNLEVFTLGEGSGFYVRAEAWRMPSAHRLCWAFGGVSGRRGKRGGDIGCESEPVGEFFQLRPQECVNNSYILRDSSARRIDSIQGRASAFLESPAANLSFHFPAGAELRIGDASVWNAGWPRLSRSAAATFPVLIGSVALKNEESLYLSIRRVATVEEQDDANNLPAAFTARSAQLSSIASSIQVAVPDPYINASAGALAVAADAIWDASNCCVMHGAVAWRVPLAGWRGPYALSALGSHARLREHVRHWIARQNKTSLVSTESPVTGAPDPGSHLSRRENLLHSRGDLSHNHYDMNLVFFDVLLRHLRWTGDIEFAREVWPALMLHLEWERRLFRRVYAVDGQDLPLYEAYACIWASDNLQYSGGGAAHSTAYNYYANRTAAQLAQLLGEDGTAFEREALLILEAMQKLLWLPEQGAFGESKDILHPQTVYTSPAVWTVYHVIDSEVATSRQAWQMAVERLSALKRIPVHGEGVPAGNWFMLSCSDWLPYIWSLNLLALAENMHTALALWQAGMATEAFQLFKGNLLDSMFQGLCPGNFHMSSELDVHRQEAQRDFGDPIGIASRALIEGLFGLKPDLLQGVLTIRPGFPSEWDHASLHHPDVDIVWRREDRHDSFEITSRFTRPVSLRLVLRALRTGSPSVMVNGVAVAAGFDPEAVGVPLLIVPGQSGAHWKVEVRWQGKEVPSRQERRTYQIGELLPLPDGIGVAQIDDPQGCLNGGRIVRSGTHVVFLPMRQENCRWRMPISFEVRPAALRLPAPAMTMRGSRIEPLDLSSIFQHRITDIFRRSYNAPRSPYCSLSIPEQGIGGWAAFDTHPEIDDSGLRSAKGSLRTPLGVSFRTPSDRNVMNCLFLSHWQQDSHSVRLPLTGHAASLFLLMAGTTFPQASRMAHGIITVQYGDGTSSKLTLRNPENWWPIEQDYLLDDYLFVDTASIPPRVDLRSGEVRLLDPVSFRGKGRSVAGGAANILQVPLDPAKALDALQIEVTLYGIVIGLLGATLVRPN